MDAIIRKRDKKAKQKEEAEIRKQRIETAKQAIAQTRADRMIQRIQAREAQKDPRTICLKKKLTDDEEESIDDTAGEEEDLSEPEFKKPKTAEVKKAEEARQATGRPPVRAASIKPSPKSNDASTVCSTSAKKKARQESTPDSKQKKSKRESTPEPKESEPATERRTRAAKRESTPEPKNKRVVSDESSPEPAPKRPVRAVRVQEKTSKPATPPPAQKKSPQEQRAERAKNRSKEADQEKEEKLSLKEQLARKKELLKKKVNAEKS